jgi:uncharacterized hydrophobic protein (TIGR00271 family)
VGVLFIVAPVWSLESIVELVGLFAFIRGVMVVVSMIRKRKPTTWDIASSAMLLISGVAIMVYGDRLLVWGTVVLAGLGGVAAILQVVAVSTYEGPGDTPVSDIVKSYIRSRPDSREDRQVLLEKVFYEGEQSGTRFARFVMLMVFASVISTTGVITDSTAVVIGAMLVAPLMIPLMGTTLSITMGWPNRMRRCAGIATCGALLAILTGALLSALVPGAVNLATNSQVTSRVSPTSIDLVIAIAAGAAGAYALSRRDVSDSLPGVAVAIALVPPLTVAGLCWQQQAWESGNGALLLFLTNAVAILLAGGATFIVLGVSPIERVSEGQKRFRTVIASLVSVSAVILLLLSLNGRSLAEADLSRAGVSTVLAEWNTENPEWTVVSQGKGGDNTLVVDLAGPGDPPGLDDLLDDLRAELSEELELRVTWIEQQQTVVGGTGDG